MNAYTKWGMNLKYIMYSKTYYIMSATILIFLCISTSWATTYYVDATLGNDLYDGISQLNAWKTIDKVNKTSFMPGDNILLKKGEIWREQLKPISSGELGNFITFESYGSGNKPVIFGSEV